MRKGLCKLGEMQEDSKKPQDLTNNNWLSFLRCVVCMFVCLFYLHIPDLGIGESSYMEAPTGADQKKPNTKK